MSAKTHCPDPAGETSKARPTLPKAGRRAWASQSFGVGSAPILQGDGVAIRVWVARHLEYAETMLVVVAQVPGRPRLGDQALGRGRARGRADLLKDLFR